MEEIEKLKRQIKIKDEYLKLIWSIGFDYDGLDGSIEGLKSVVDDLVGYARMALENDDTSVIYGGIDEDDIKKNILFEEIKKEG